MNLGGTLEEAFGDHGWLAEKFAAEAVEEPGGMIRISWDYEATRICRRTIWFSREREYVPERFEDRYRKMIGETGGFVEPLEYGVPEIVVSVTWKQSAGVWLPSTASFVTYGDTRTAPYQPTSTRKYSLSFAWESVNDQIPDRYFSPLDFDDRTVKTTVVDHRIADGGTK